MHRAFFVVPRFALVVLCFTQFVWANSKDFEVRVNDASSESRKPNSEETQRNEDHHNKTGAKEGSDISDKMVHWALEKCKPFVAKVGQCCQANPDESCSVKRKNSAVHHLKSQFDNQHDPQDVSSSQVSAMGATESAHRTEQLYNDARDAAMEVNMECRRAQTSCKSNCSQFLKSASALCENCSLKPVEKMIAECKSDFHVAVPENRDHKQNSKDHEKDLKIDDAKLFDARDQLQKTIPEEPNGKGELEKQFPAGVKGSEFQFAHFGRSGEHAHIGDPAEKMVQGKVEVSQEAAEDNGRHGTVRDDLTSSRQPAKQADFYNRSSGREEGGGGEYHHHHEHMHGASETHSHHAEEEGMAGAGSRNAGAAKMAVASAALETLTGMMQKRPTAPVPNPQQRLPSAYNVSPSEPSPQESALNQPPQQNSPPQASGSAFEVRGLERSIASTGSGSVRGVARPLMNAEQNPGSYPGGVQPVVYNDPGSFRSRAMSWARWIPFGLDSTPLKRQPEPYRSIGKGDVDEGGGGGFGMLAKSKKQAPPTLPLSAYLPGGSHYNRAQAVGGTVAERSSSADIQGARTNVFNQVSTRLQNLCRAGRLYDCR